MEGDVGSRADSHPTTSRFLRKIMILPCRIFFRRGTLIPGGRKKGRADRGAEHPTSKKDGTSPLFARMNFSS